MASTTTAWKPARTIGVDRHDFEWLVEQTANVFCFCSQLNAFEKNFVAFADDVRCSFPFNIGGFYNGEYRAGCGHGASQSLPACLVRARPLAGRTYSRHPVQSKINIQI